MNKVLCALLLIAHAAVAPAAAASIEEEGKAFEFSLSDFQLRTLPGGWFYSNFFENLAPDATSLIEESNGFALLDTPRIYFEGDPYFRFQWSLQGVPLDSLLDVGGPAVGLPFSALAGFRLRGETPLARRYGLDFGLVPDDSSFSRLALSSVYTDLGSFAGWGKWMLAPHAVTRSPGLYSTRRKLLDNFFVDGAFQKRWRSAALLFAADYFSCGRQFNDFNVRDTVFEENGKALSVFSRFTGAWRGGRLEANAAFYRQDRDRFGAETGRYPQETFFRVRDAFFTSFSLAHREFRAALFFQSENDDRRPQVMDFSKDIFDIDGESLFPFDRWGEFSGLRLGWQVAQSFLLRLAERDARITAFFDGEQRWLSGVEGNFNANPITAGGRPYQVILWNPGEPYRNRGSALRAGFMLQVPVGRAASLLGKLRLQRQSVSFADAGNDLDFWRPDFDLGLVLNERRNPEVMIAYGRLGYDLGSEINFFLEKARPSGAIRRWQDGNGDGVFQATEAGEIFGYTGGASHGLDGNLRLPERDRFLLGLTTRMSCNFRLEVKGLYKRLRHPFSVEYEEEYGHFETVDGRALYFFDRLVSGYRLSNSSSAKDPFYAQFMMRIHGQKERKWYFSLSFLAHIGMGTTAFGNGAGANDIGIIDESRANPNSWINSYGRLDGDRAFVGRVYFGFYLTPRLFLGGSIKYRDGDPFAFIDSYYRSGQWVLIYHDIKAEDEYGRKGGPREDCVWDFNFKLSWFVKLFGHEAALELSAFNLLDFGSELSENVFSGGLRQANELQLARTVRFGMTIDL